MSKVNTYQAKSSKSFAAHKLIYIANMVISFLILLGAIIVLITVLMSRAAGETPRIFGRTIHIVVSQSMEPDILVGDLLVATDIDIAQIVVGDDIIYRSMDPLSYEKIIVHRVIKVGNDTSGNISLTTAGINNPTPDAYPVTAIIGKAIWQSRSLGRLIMFFSNMQNLIVLAVIAFIVILALKLGTKLFAKYSNTRAELAKKAKLLAEAKAELAQQLRLLTLGENSPSDDIKLKDNNE
ncbi:MAG: signal peptidase I [Christensenellaceae bacterium]|jgi:signal peptidase I|nr:signal peptidase I [Christensenellaceae bacterium]